MKQLKYLIHVLSFIFVYKFYRHRYIVHPRSALQVIDGVDLSYFEIWRLYLVNIDEYMHK